MIEKKFATGCCDHDYCAGWNDAVDEMPRWISVEEKLPETQTAVMLVLQRDGGGTRIAIGYRAHWTPARYYIDGGSCAVDANRVTHWMPLPEPPKEE